MQNICQSGYIHDSGASWGSKWYLLLQKQVQGRALPHTGVWVGCRCREPDGVVLKPEQSLMYSQATCQYLQSKEQQLCWGLIFCLVIVATRSVCPHRTQGLQAEPLLFFRVWILLPFSAISLTFIFSTYNEMYFSTGLFFNRLYCSSPHANFFWTQSYIYIHHQQNGVVERKILAQKLKFTKNPQIEGHQQN